MDNIEDHYTILQRAKEPAKEVWQQHVNGFVNSFVIKERRERWCELLINRPKGLFANSAKLHNHLDWSVCALIQDESFPAERNRAGIYFDFYGEPKILFAQDAVLVGTGHDGLFFIEAGKEAIFFFHECEVYICRK